MGRCGQESEEARSQKTADGDADGSQHSGASSRQENPGTCLARAQSPSTLLGATLSVSKGRRQPSGHEHGLPLRGAGSKGQAPRGAYGEGDATARGLGDAPGPLYG